MSRTLPFPSSRFEMRHCLLRTNRARVAQARLLVLIQGPRDNTLPRSRSKKRKAWLGWLVEVSQPDWLVRGKAHATFL